MSTPRSSGSGSDYSEQFEALRRELSALGERIEQLPARQPQAVSFERHFRRFMPFYALATVWVLMLVLFPTVNRSSVDEQLGGVGVRDSATAAGSTTEVADDEAVDPSGAPVSGGAGPGTTNRPTLRPTGPQKVGPVLPPTVKVGSGVTRGGFECKPGVRQLPWSEYATACVAKFEGDNGGATSRGVTKDTITIAVRKFPDSANSEAVAAFAQAAGAASEDVANAVRDTFRDYFGKAFETYGRKVQWVDYEASAQSNSTEEAQSRGKEGACIDATKVAQEIKAFMTESASGPYGECLAERQVVSIGAGAYFPETWYRKYHPYLFNGVMECERISYQVAEYVGKRLLGRKAKWAGDPVFQTQNRKFGTYVPNNDEYQHCVNISERELKQKYGGEVTSRYNYTLDVSRFPDEAARGIVQFKAAGVTTVINACDPYSTLFLTQAATSQAYKPEWYIIGVASQDVDSVARLFDQSQVNGHLFGMSQLGDQSKLWGPASEPGVTYKKITGKDIPPGTNGDYYTLLRLFNFVQSAGPTLNPATFEKGVHSIMSGGPPTFAVGYVSFQDGPDGTVGATDHTGIDDSREIYWCGACKSKVDGKDGAYVETYGGKRFRNHEWPAEEPPVYPQA